MTDKPRLIEVAFPLKQTSMDSVHEKNVRHGHISTLHIWPARRPLAACRAALIATLLPDPGNEEERRKLLEKLAGKVIQVSKKKKLPGGKIEETIAEETEGGILHWGRESGPDLDWFRQEIRKVYGGRPPRVLDPFAGGGAIPLEAMRLGCEATAIDINPVAWFILKCTLEYPQRLAGQCRPLPSFALDSVEFMENFFKEAGKSAKVKPGTRQMVLSPPPEVDLAWHVRAWGFWVLQRAKTDLERFYPVVDGKPTVAYLWARTVKCKNCRATVPLLKTRWLCKKEKKRVLLTMEPNADQTGVVFGVETDVPTGEGSAAQKREHDKQIGAGTMTGSGARCLCCKAAIMTMEDIRLEGKAGRLGAIMTAVVVDGAKGKEYRIPTGEEIRLAAEAENEVERVFAEIPYGLPKEPLPGKEALGFRVPLYGLDQWYKLFTPRQLLALGTFVKHTRAARDAMRGEGYPEEWVEAVGGYLALAIDRLVSFNSANVRWKVDAEAVVDAFARFALPILWDYSEAISISKFAGSYLLCYERIALAIGTVLSLQSSEIPSIINRSATTAKGCDSDIVITDPPYYDAIPYSDLMDFFYIWLRRSLPGSSPEIDNVFNDTLAPKWNHNQSDGELIDDASRFEGDKQKSKAA
ncbi:MAG: DUF1156 domain-containing protein [bacterium]